MQVVLHNKGITFWGGNIIFHQCDDSRILSPFLMTLMEEELKLKCDSSVPFSADCPLHCHRMQAKV